MASRRTRTTCSPISVTHFGRVRRVAIPRSSTTTAPVDMTKGDVDRGLDGGGVAGENLKIGGGRRGRGSRNGESSHADKMLSGIGKAIRSRATTRHSAILDRGGPANRQILIHDAPPSRPPRRNIHDSGQLRRGP